MQRLKSTLERECTYDIIPYLETVFFVLEQLREVVQVPVGALNGSSTAVIEIDEGVRNEEGEDQEIIIVTRSRDEPSVHERLERLQSLQARFVTKRKCRLCLELKEAKSLMQIEDDKVMYREFTVRNMLELVVPELNLKRYPKSEICSECKNLLVASFQFKEIWKGTYEKLQELENKELEYLASQPSIVISDNESEPDVNTSYNETLHNSDHGAGDDASTELVNSLESFPQPPLPSEPSYKTVTYFDHDYINLAGVSVKVRVKRSRTKEGGMCEHCGLYFARFKGMQRHLHRAHVTLVCEKCGDVCEGFNALAKHRRVDHRVIIRRKQRAVKVTPECHICSKTFRSKDSLKWHVLAHYNIRRQLQCHTCGKTLGNAQTLRLHLKRHMSRDKNYACEQCGKTFYLPAELRKHLKSHTNTYHICKICGRKMKHAHALKRHIQVFHLRIDNLCDICDRPYFKKYDLIKHKVREHGWVPPQDENVGPQNDIPPEILSQLMEEGWVPNKTVEPKKDVLQEAVSQIMDTEKDDESQQE